MSRHPRVTRLPQGKGADIRGEWGERGSPHPTDLVPPLRHGSWRTRAPSAERGSGGEVESTSFGKLLGRSAHPALRPGSLGHERWTRAGQAGGAGRSGSARSRAVPAAPLLRARSPLAFRPPRSPLPSPARVIGDERIVRPVVRGRCRRRTAWRSKVTWGQRSGFGARRQGSRGSDGRDPPMTSIGGSQGGRSNSLRRA